MVTFFIALALLIGGYLIYSRVSEKVFAIDNRKTPAIANPDGVDITPLPRWKAFLVELLNIAGTGPIFGAISGALFGPIVFLWIVLGCILGGAVHDYFSGMISSRNNGESIVKLAGKYSGRVIEIIMRVFSIILLILVTAVFVVSPSTLLDSLTAGNVKAWVWMIIILIYYFVSTIVPIDKIIGKIYPVFGIILIVMAVAVIIGVMVQSNNYPMLELIGNLRDFSKENGSLPWWPFMMTTVACGAVSGFHATQSPMIAKCIKSEKEGRKVFYGAMISESVIALVWAAAGVAFYGTTQLLNDALKSGASNVVYEIATGVLGVFGGVLAIAGVIVCPITSGDTAFRSARLIVAESVKSDQKEILNRIFITIPILAIGGLLTWFAISDDNGFQTIWRYFSWSNQTLAMIALWVATSYLIKKCKYRYGSLLTALPATFMSGVSMTYILIAEEGLELSPSIAYPVGVAFAVILFIIYVIVWWRYVFRKKEISNDDNAL